MRKYNYLNFNAIFFIGIGGISMSALAKLCVANGYVVGGSDATLSDATENLKKLGIKISIGHKANNIKKFKPDLVVYTAAIKPDNEELIFAKNNNIEVLERADFLGEICKKYTNVISIGGTHGKTTTTSMIAEIFEVAGLKPTVHVGGTIKNFNSNLLIGNNDYFITEACEYKKSFEKIYSTCAVITNIEEDHMDCYIDKKDLIKSFKIFAENSSDMVVTSCEILKDIIDKKLSIYLCGKDGFYDYSAKNLVSNYGNYEFDVFEFDKFLMHFKLNVMGIYNVTNALFAICVSRLHNVPLNSIYNGLLGFNGVKRRNEFMGKIEGVKVFADYCHHPTEIKNSIISFKECYKNILCVFQPHTYSRTIALMKNFCNCFKGVKKLIVFKTYPAREEYNEKGSETEMFKNLKLKNKSLCLSYDVLDAEIKKSLKGIDVVIVLGAGDMYEHFTNLSN